MHELNDIIFSAGQFTLDEHNVKFVDLIEDGVAGEYVVLVSCEAEDDDYLALFAQIHFLAKTSGGYQAMVVPIVDSFNGRLETKDGATVKGEAEFLQQELSYDVGLLNKFQEKYAKRAELVSGFDLSESPWDEFRRWLHSKNPEPSPFL